MNDNKHSKISKALLLRYTASLAAVVAGVLLFTLLSWIFLSQFAWQSDSFLYRVFSFIKERIAVAIGGAILLGWATVSFAYLSKPLRYLDGLVMAAEALAHPSEAEIKLPRELSDIQAELNAVREKALYDAMVAREAEQRKNDLVVYLAHDLKTPLTSVLGYVTLLCDEPDVAPDVRIRYLQVVKEKALRLEDLINEFFEITRFNLTTLELEPEKINLTRMLEQTTYEFNPLLLKKGLSWDLQLEPGVFAMCDADKMERVFDNLLRNAVNYSYPEERIAVKLRQEEGQVVLQIENRGKTIAPEKISRIFEQFFRLDTARSSATGGAGLGLAIAKQIVEGHGGSIAAESGDGRVTFTVRLPAADQKIV